MKSAVICLMGPTASGKTQAALYLADKFPLHIISVDSALVYRDMNIGTAKPDQNTLKKYPHALVDIIDPTERYSAAHFRTDATKEIKWALENSKIPLLVGGTFLYFKTLLEGISPIPEAAPEVQKELANTLNDDGLSALYQKLSQYDPETAQRLSPNDTQRILRALEVYLTTGKTLSYFWTLPKKAPLSYPYIKLALCSNQTDIRNQYIAKRFHEMIKVGFIDEVKHLKTKYPELNVDYPSLRAVGYRQIWEFTEGTESLEIAIDKAIIATRQYAKRQRTWLRSESDLIQINIDDSQYLSKVTTTIECFLR